MDEATLGTGGAKRPAPSRMSLSHAPSETPPSPQAAGFRLSRAAWAGLGAIALIYFWFVTHGTWRLFAAEDFGQFFDYQALSFLHGRLDVPEKAIGLEAFVHHGKYYGYWGPFPALLRLPLAVFGEGAWVGHTARLSVLTAALLTVVAFWGIADELRRLARAELRHAWIISLTLAGLALGSTLLFLLSWSYVFHEVIAWAGALAHVAFWAGLRHLRTQSLASAAALFFAAAGAALTRPTTGYGAVLGAALVLAFTVARAWRGQGPAWLADRRGLKAAGLAGGFAAAGFLPLAYNYVRFGTISPPFQEYRLSTPERLAKTDGGHVIQPGNLPATLRAYFSLHQLQVAPRFPFFFLQTYAPAPGTRQKLDLIEPFASLTLTVTGLLVLAVAGAGFCLRRPPVLLVVAGAGAAAGLIGLFTTLTERYLHDFLPLLSLLALAGAVALAGVPRRLGAGLRTVVAGLLALSVLEFSAFTLTYQRVEATRSQEEKTRFADFSARIDARVTALTNRLFHLPLPVVEVADWTQLPPARAGIVARRTAPAGLLWHDGRKWRLLSGVCDEILERDLEVTLPAADVPSSEPLLAVGQPGRATLLSLRCLGPGEWAASCEIWGRLYRLGSPFSPPADRILRLHLVIDRINGEISVERGGAALVDLHELAHPIAGLQAHVGANPFGGSYTSERFTGQIRELPVSH